MGVNCANCGEPLLGSVNRCWKCGQQVLSTPDAAIAPPVRRAGVTVSPADETTDNDASEVVQAILAPDAPDESTELPKIEVTHAQRTAPPPVHVTNPVALRPIETVAPVRPAEYRKGGWANGLAIASVVLGVLAVIFGSFSGAVILFAAIGLACGIMGLPSQRRTLAVAGLLLCLFGTTISSVRLAYDTYVFVRGESPVPMEVDTGDEFFPGPLE